MMLPPVRRKCVWGASRRLLSLLVLCFGLSAGVASAQNYSVRWDRNADPYTAGYRVFGGTRSGVYDWSADVGNATVASLPPLAPGSTYYFVVRAYNAAGELGPPSNEAALDLGPPGVPTGLSAASVGSRVTLSWGAPVEGPVASQYLISVGTASGADDLVRGFNVGNQRSVSGDLPPGRYYARVQAANTAGAGPPSPAIAFVVGGPAQPQSPSGLGVAWNGTAATLSWNASVGSSSYLIEAGSAPGASNLAIFNVGATTSYSVDVPPGTFYVRVRGFNASGISAPSNEIVLQGVGAPGRPTSLAATSTPTAVTLRWGAPAGGSTPTGYIVEVGSGPGLSNLAVVQLGNQTSVVAASPPPGVYYVRVRAVNARGASQPSNEILVRR